MEENKELQELKDDELEQVSGGVKNPFGYIQYGTMGQPAVGAEVKVSSPVATVRPDEIVNMTILKDAAEPANMLERR